MFRRRHQGTYFEIIAFPIHHPALKAFEAEKVFDPRFLQNYGI